MFCAESEKQVKQTYCYHVVIGYRRYTQGNSQSKQENSRAYLSPTISIKFENVVSCYGIPLTAQPCKYSGAGRL